MMSLLEDLLQADPPPRVPY